MTLKVPGALWVPKWAGAPELVAAFRRARLERGTRWEESPAWIAGQLGLDRRTVRNALRELPETGHAPELLAPIHGRLVSARLPVRARLLATHIWRRNDLAPARGYHPTVRDLAEDFSWSKSTVDRMLARLTESGHLVEEVVHVQGSKTQLRRRIVFEELSPGLSPNGSPDPQVGKTGPGEWVKPGPVSGENRARQVGKTGPGTRRYQEVPVPHPGNLYRCTAEGGTAGPEEGRSASASRRSPGLEGRAPSGARRFAFALPPLPPGTPLGVADDPTWRRVLLPETREGLEAGPVGPALAWLLSTLGVGAAYRLGRELARDGFGVRQVLDHVARIHKLHGIRNRPALLASELRELLQGSR